MNWINSWNAGNKKEKYEINFRIGTLTILEIIYCPCEICENKKTSCAKFRMLVLNLQVYQHRIPEWQDDFGEMEQI